jgi:hypothetical protein
MVKYPEVQRKAQEELDSVLGTSRMPTFSDLPKLPYVSAIMKEVLRWHAIAPQGNVFSGYGSQLFAELCVEMEASPIVSGRMMSTVGTGFLRGR